jgi:import inner membrane translocase subunit TIM44
MSFALLTRRHNSSFIKNVMEQVKKEVDHDPKMKQAWEDFAQRKKATESRFQGVKAPFHLNTSAFEKLRESQAFSNSSKLFRETLSRSAAIAEPFKSKFSGMDLSRKLENVVQNPAFNKVKSATGTVSSTISKMSKKLGLETKEENVSTSFERWKQVRDATVKAEEKRKADNEPHPEASSSEEARENIAAEHSSSPTDGLVVSDRGNSSWDRFGANMKDMPFLNAFYNNPLMDSLFGETEISASIRQMRESVDVNFRLDEFIQEIENIVTPKFVKWYLEGNAEKLKHHCGEAAFAAVNASISARQKQKLQLDTNILSGPSDFELKAAKSGSMGEAEAGTASPLFVFTFNAQQINCLRDEDGNVVEGAVDDIRQLFYAIAVQRNPKANTSSNLDFPWQIQEIAILGNQPCW